MQLTRVQSKGPHGHITRPFQRHLWIWACERVPLEYATHTPPKPCIVESPYFQHGQRYRRRNYLSFSLDPRVPFFWESFTARTALSVTHLAASVYRILRVCTHALRQHIHTKPRLATSLDAPRSSLHLPYLSFQPYEDSHPRNIANLGCFAFFIRPCS